MVAGDTSLAVTNTLVPTPPPGGGAELPAIPPLVTPPATLPFTGTML